MKNILKDLDFKKNQIYETIVTTYLNGGENSAPMGISTTDFEGIDLEIYKTSKTCKNILGGGDFVINLTDDLNIFYRSVFESENSGYGKAKKVNAPVLRDADGILEMRVTSVEELGEKVKVRAEIVDFHFNEGEGRKPNLNLINRADALALECLIKATKIPSSCISENEREKLKGEITCISRVVAKVAPGSGAESLVEKALSALSLSR